MVLVTGPTGSGKTTTLYAALSEIKSVEDKIITIEDPVEYQLRGITQIPINEKKGLTFARGLRSILRHDPDKIMVGEIRDPETAQIAIQSALTGHLVFTTVHANNVLDVLGPLPQHGRRAVPVRLGAQLRAGAAPGARDLHALQAAGAARPGAAGGVGAGSRRWPSTHTFYEGAGCIECGGTGLQGADGDLRTARPDRPHPRDDSGQAARPPRSRRSRARRACGSCASRRSTACWRAHARCARSTR